MENMEKYGLPQESAHTTELLQPPAEPVKRSPYENSPYMMPHRPQNSYQTPGPEPVRPQPPKARKPRKTQKGRTWLAVLALFFGMCAAVSAASSLTASYLENRTNLQLEAMESEIEVLRAELDALSKVSEGESVSGTPNVTADGSLTPGQVYAKNERSVVLIDTDVATGSGFIITADGYVVTNYHVVEDARTIHVVLFDNTSYTAALTGYDASNDVAVLKMEGEKFQPVKLGSSDDLIVGDQVVAIGNPLGELTSTLTVGYVSAKGRDVSTDTTTINMIQTDCAINSGNSGGPLFNMKGEVVGITSAKYSGQSASGASIEGIGFAIPMDDAAGIIDDLMEFGYVRSAYLGVTVYTVQPSDAEMFGRPLGCLVNEVTPGSCAHAAGLLKADVITGLGGYKVESYTDLSRALRTFNGGETTTITVDRNGQKLVLEITLDERPRENQSAAPGNDPSGMPENNSSEMPENGTYEDWFKYFFGE